MGVPIITLPGIHWRSRITYGIYRQIGIMDCVATSLAEFAQLAVRVVLDDAFRDQMSAKLIASHDKIFEDKTAVDEWQKFFLKAFDKVQRPVEYEKMIT